MEEKSSQLDALAVESEYLLCSEQKARLHDLERVVERNLCSFLEAGRALLRIRDEGLYRAYGTFEEYLRLRWGLTYSQGASLLRSTRVAEQLLAGPAGADGDAPLPVELSEATLRPLQRVGPRLACAVWRLASRITEKPTPEIVSRIVRTVSAAIEAGQSNGSAASRREAKRAQKAIFLASVNRLAAGGSFSGELIAGRIRDLQQAQRCCTACRILISRLEWILRELEGRFPGL